MVVQSQTDENKSILKFIYTVIYIYIHINIHIHIYIYIYLYIHYIIVGELSIHFMDQIFQNTGVSIWVLGI